MRLFVAIALDDTVRERLANYQRALQHYRADIKWARPEGMHLTLAFLGEIDDALLPLLIEAVDEAAAAGRAMSLRVEGVGSFGRTHLPRVLWAAIGGDTDALTDLQQALVRGLLDAGFEMDDRSFSPHVTLGRVRGRRVASLVHVLETEASMAFGTIEATSLDLIQSHPEPEGARYTTLHRAPLT